MNKNLIRHLSNIPVPTEDEHDVATNIFYHGACLQGEVAMLAD